MGKKVERDFVDGSMSSSDDHLAKKWAGPRVVYSETNRPVDAGIDFSDDPGKTDGSQAAECDVNTIVDRFTKTGILPGVDAERMYADVSDVGTYQESLHVVMRAQEQFDSLDAFVRKKFDNDPAKFLEFCADPKNAEEMVKLGLATERSPSGTDRIVEAINASNRVSGEVPAPEEPSKPAPSPSAKKK